MVQRKHFRCKRDLLARGHPHWSWRSRDITALLPCPKTEVNTVLIVSFPEFDWAWRQRLQPGRGLFFSLPALVPILRFFSVASLFACSTLHSSLSMIDAVHCCSYSSPPLPCCKPFDFSQRTSFNCLGHSAFLPQSIYYPYLSPIRPLDHRGFNTIKRCLQLTQSSDY